MTQPSAGRDPCDELPRGAHESRPRVQNTSGGAEQLGWYNCVEGWAALQGGVAAPRQEPPRPLRQSRPPSAPPAAAGSEPALRVNNSLHSSHGMCDWAASTARGATLTWYACGPTVYDVAHLGHARNYVSFDIIRRVLEDYFNKQVYMVMGVTDVDDKIIVRTRQIGELVAEGWEWESARAALAQAPCHLDPAALVASARAALQASGKARLSPEHAQATVPRVQTAPAPEGVVLNEGLDISPLTREMERRFWSNMERLGVRFPRAVTRVTEHIAEIIRFVESLIAKGYAYESNGSVYFNTEAFRAAPAHRYAKLVPSAADDLALCQTGEGVLSQRCPQGEKRSSGDFTLWKKSLPEEPRWQSPWGYGRPGWHVECSAMASHVLGENIDVHTGGEDLKFPHHDNELAAAEAYWGHSHWVGVFMHSGQLHIDGRRLAKAQGTLDAALEQYTPQQLRWLFLLHAYDAPIMFGCRSMQQALREEQVWNSFCDFLRGYLLNQTSPCAISQTHRWGPLEEQLSRKLSEVQQAVDAALCENFNTPKVLAHLRGLADSTREYVSARERESPCGVRLLLLHSVDNYCRSMLRLFGIQLDAGAAPASAPAVAPAAGPAAAPAAAAAARQRSSPPRPGAAAGGLQQQRAEAAPALAGFQREVVAKALGALRSSDPGVRAMAAELLSAADRAGAREVLPLFEPQPPSPPPPSPPSSSSPPPTMRRQQQQQQQQQRESPRHQRKQGRPQEQEKQQPQPQQQLQQQQPQQPEQPRPPAAGECPAPAAPQPGSEGSSPAGSSVAGNSPTTASPAGASGQLAAAAAGVPAPGADATIPLWYDVCVVGGRRLLTCPLAGSGGVPAGAGLQDGEGARRCPEEPWSGGGPRLEGSGSD